MSAVEPDIREAKSSVKISCNAKGEAQPEVKLVDGVAEEEILRLRELAIETYLETARRTRFQTGGQS